MKKLLLTLLAILLVYGAFAQTYAVELASYAVAPQKEYFGKIKGVYETLDVNYIYRYYKDAKTKEEAEQILEKVKEAGFVHARIINFEELKAQCNNTCAYSPPAKTGIVYEPAPPIKIEQLVPIFFHFDKYYLTEESKKELKKYASYLNQNQSHTLIIVAHTDSKGDTEYNQVLSQNRATTATKYLTDKGISRSRIKIETKGEGKPVAKNELEAGADSELGRKLNRRIEFKILDSSNNLLNIVQAVKVPDHLK